MKRKILFLILSMTVVAHAVAAESTFARQN